MHPKALEVMTTLGGQVGRNMERDWLESVSYCAIRVGGSVNVGMLCSMIHVSVPPEVDGHLDWAEHSLR